MILYKDTGLNYVNAYFFLLTGQVLVVFVTLSTIYYLYEKEIAKKNVLNHINDPALLCLNFYFYHASSRIR